MGIDIINNNPNLLKRFIEDAKERSEQYYKDNPDS